MPLSLALKQHREDKYMKGITTIELTNVETGEVESTTDFNMATDALTNIFSDRSGWGSGSLYEYLIGSSNLVVGELFGTLRLLEEPLSTDPSDIHWDLNSKLIGRGGYNVAKPGDYTLGDMGTFNAVESGFVSSNEYKFVYDFDTSSANGTISCVTLSPLRTIDCFIMEPTIKPKIQLTYAGTDYMPYRGNLVDNSVVLNDGYGNLYIYQNSKPTDVLPLMNSSYFTLGKEISTLNISDIEGLVCRSPIFVERGTNNLILGNSTSPSKISKLNLDDNTFVSSNLSSLPKMYYTPCEDTSKLYLTKLDDTVLTLHIYDLSQVGVIDTLEPEVYEVTIGISTTEERGHFVLGDGQFVSIYGMTFNSTTGEYVGRIYSLDYLDELTSMSGTRLFATDSGSTHNLLHPQLIFTKNNLDVPVVKTSSYTMKVTYTIKIE